MCQIMGFHRDTFYKFRRAFQRGGVASLVEERRGPRGPHPNRGNPEIEAGILAYALRWPAALATFELSDAPIRMRVL